jgi:predicted Holliday junction resolvase-like endonuclease
MITILKYWYYIIIGVFCIYIAYLHIDNYILKAQISTLESKLAASQALIDEQNKAIEKWKEEGIALEKEVKLKEKEISEAARMSQKRANNLLKEKVPKDCQGAILWFLENKNKLY